MSTHADKTQANISQSVTSALGQKESVSETAFQFADNHTETIAQRKLQEIANCSPQVQRLARYQEMATNYLAPIQGKFIFNKKEYDEELLSREDLLLLWGQLEKDESAEHQSIKHRISYTFYSRFGEFIAKAAAPKSEKVKPDKAETAKYSPEIVTDANSKKVMKTVEDWGKYALKVKDSLSPLHNELIAKRMEIGELAFNNKDNVEFKKLYKKLNTDLQHLRATKYTCAVILNALKEKNFKSLRIFVLGEHIQAVMMNTGSTAGIDELAADPRNIIPDFNQTKVAKGLARAILSLSILETRKENKGEGKPISLLPHNRKTKRVYNALGFIVSGVGPKPKKDDYKKKIEGLSYKSKTMLDAQMDIAGKEYLAASEDEKEKKENEATRIEDEARIFKNRSPWHASMGAMHLPVDKQQALIERGNLKIPDYLKEYVGK